MLWEMVALQKIASIERSVVQPEVIEHGTAYLGLEHIEAGGRILGKQYVDEGELASAKFLFTPRHLLFGKLRPYLAKIALPDFEGICSTDILPVLPSDSLDRRYLAFFLRQPSLVDYANSRAIGANLPRLSPSELGRITIPLPPIEEQKRIAAILDAADALRAKRRESIAQLDALLQSTFLDMFGDPVTNPMGWDESAKLGELAEIVSGVTKGRKINGKSTREVPYLAVSNVQDRHLLLEAVKTIEATNDEIIKYSLRFHDILLTEGGDPDKLGRGSLWHDAIPDCIHQNHVFRVRLLSLERLIPVFLNWLIGSAKGKSYFLRSAKQTTGIASINMRQLRAFPLLIPPLSLQRRFASIVEAAERQKARLRAHLDELDALFASLQSRAFNGEL